MKKGEVIMKGVKKAMEQKTNTHQETKKLAMDILSSKLGYKTSLRNIQLLIDVINKMDSESIFPPIRYSDTC